MRHLFFFLVVMAVLTGCQKPKETVTEPVAKDTVATAPVKLTLKWETDTVLTTCESVLYDKDGDVLYVANINGGEDAKDKNGFISKVSLDGKVSELQWAKGMDAPKGMGLFNGKLYVADIDRVHEVDTKTGKITKTHKIKDAKFLNDITTDAAGKVYISDTGTGVISVIENGKVSVWLDSLKGGPNGLLAEPNQLLLLSFEGQTLSSIDPSTKQITEKTQGVDSGDGIEAIGDGAYLASSWNGMIHYIGADNKLFTLLDLRADSVNAADIEYIQEKNLLLVPTFFKNTVRAYEVSK
jgi:DNA-binding beta-propeller fold protein YncE